MLRNEVAKRRQEADAIAAAIKVIEGSLPKKVAHKANNADKSAHQKLKQKYDELHKKLANKASMLSRLRKQLKEQTDVPKKKGTSKPNATEQNLRKALKKIHADFKAYRRKDIDIKPGYVSNDDGVDEVMKEIEAKQKQSYKFS